MKLPSKGQIQGVYAIADAAWNRFPSIGILVQQLLDGGCRLLQLRMKDVPYPDVLAAARDAAIRCRECGAVLIINDYADIAVEVHAAGVHVGEHDAPVAQLRRDFGNQLLIGYSAHSFEEARRAEQDGADYVAFGAIFPTRTKGPGHPVQGIEKLSELIRTISVPVVAIGGIARENINLVHSTGVSAIAMISSLCAASDVIAETRWFTQYWANKR